VNHESKAKLSMFSFIFNFSKSTRANIANTVNLKPPPPQPPQINEVQSDCKEASWKTKKEMN
jgi:hypothetical protein